MPKKAKHKKQNSGKNKPQEIVIREGQRHISHEEYYAADADKEESHNSAPQQKNRKESLKPKTIIRMAIICLGAALAVLVFLNWDNFAPENLMLWFRTKIMGTGVGDGYPVSIKGNSADSSNFLNYDGNCAVLSDTTFTVTSSTGKEIMNFRHSYNNPGMALSQNRFLLYNTGGTGYALVNTEETEKKQATDKITVGDIAKNGRYALVTQPADYASQLSVYLPGGTRKYVYEFADSYVSAMSINNDGTKGIVSAVQSESGKLYSTVYVFDFNSEEPVASFVSQDNLISAVAYSRGGTAYAVGDEKTVFFNGKDEFSEYDYGKKTLTAVSADESSVLVSVSGYARNGPCTILAFTGQAQPYEIESQEYISALSAYGNSFAALGSNTVFSYDYSGKLLGTTPAGYDAKGISLANERDVYILGVREIRFSTIGMDNSAQSPQTSASPSPKASDTPAPSDSAKAADSPRPTDTQKSEGSLEPSGSTSTAPSATANSSEG